MREYSGIGGKYSMICCAVYEEVIQAMDRKTT